MQPLEGTSLGIDPQTPPTFCNVIHNKIFQLREQKRQKLLFFFFYFSTRIHHFHGALISAPSVSSTTKRREIHFHEHDFFFLLNFPLKQFFNSNP